MKEAHLGQSDWGELFGYLLDSHSLTEQANQTLAVVKLHSGNKRHLLLSEYPRHRNRCLACALRERMRVECAAKKPVALLQIKVKQFPNIYLVLHSRYAILAFIWTTKLKTN